MLGLMRKHAGSWIIKIILGVIALAFALSFGVYSYFGERQEVALQVNDEPITQTQIREEMGKLSEQARRQLGAQFDRLAPLLNLKQRAIDQLVDKVLLFQAAARMGISVSDAEVQRKVMEMPIFQRNGRFELGRYQAALSANRLSPEDFEEGLRSELSLNKLSTLIVGSTQVTPLELDQTLTRELTKIKGVYRVFDPETFLAEQKVTPAEMEAFHKSHPNLYLEPEKVVLTYITFPKSLYRGQVDIVDEDIKDAYDINLDRYAQPERVRARHILFKLDKEARPAEIEAAKKKAEDVMALAKKPDADFAVLAKKYSQGPTAATGGDLGEFKRGQMVGPFEKLVFEQLKPGEIGTVKTQFGYHVVKLEEKKAPQITPLEKVSGKIREELTEKMAAELALAAAETAFEVAAANGDMTATAKTSGRSTDDTKAFTITEKLEALPGLAGLAQNLESASEGDLLPIMSYDDGSVLALLKTRIPEKIKPLKEVEENVRLAVRDEKAKKAAEKAAADLIKALAGDKDPAAKLAADKKAAQTDWLARNGSIKGLENSGRLVSVLFDRPAAKPVLTQPVEAGKGFAAAVLKQSQAPSSDEKELKSKQTKERLLSQKRQELIKGFLDDLRSKAQIKTLVKM